jgi:hypothetical protein
MTNRSFEVTGLPGGGAGGMTNEEIAEVLEG